MRASKKTKKIYFRRRSKTGSQILPSRRRYFIIDSSDYGKVNPYKWSCHDHRGYVRSIINGERIYLHRFLIGSVKGKDIDHINGDNLDNRRSNLRFVTRQQNLFNSRRKHKGLKGAYFDKTHQYWVSWIMINAKAKFLGCHPTERRAGLAYDNAARQLFGEYARTNFKLNRGIRSINQGDSNGIKREIARTKR
jgi:hypothetical protein